MTDGMFLQALEFCAQNLLALSAAYLFALRAFHDGDRLHLLVATTAGYLLVAFFPVLILGTAGVLSIVPLLLVLLVLNGALFWGPGFPRAALQRPPAPAQMPSGTGRTVTAGIALALVVVFVLPPVIRPLVKGPVFSSDDLSYHAPFVAQWLLDGRISFVGSSLSTYYPFNSEIFSLWFMIPFRADGLVGLAGVYWIGLLALLLFAIARRMGVPGSVAATSAALMLASPIVATSANRFSAVDFAGPVAMLSALFFFWEYRLAAASQRARGADLVYGGLLAGFAVGVKVPLAVPCGFILLWMFAAGGGRRWKAVLIAAIAMGAAGAYWYVRNLIATGNPIYPAEALVFSGPFGAAEQTRTKLVTWIVNSPLNLQQWKYVALTLLDWPLSLGFLAVIGYAGAIIALVRRGPGFSAGDRQFLLLIVLVGIISLLMFPFMPFSGTDNAPDAPLRVEARFIILPFLSGILLWSMLWSRHQGGQTIFFALSVAAVLGAWDGGTLKLLALMVVAAVFLVLPRRLWDVLRAVLFSLRGALAFAVLLYAAVLLLGPEIQERADNEVFAYQWDGRPLGEAWRTVNALPPGSTIACIGSAAQHYYPAFGRQLDKIPVPVSADGSTPLPLHALQRAPGDTSTYWSPEPPPRLDRLVGNLRGLGLEYVMLAQEEPGVWPGQYGVLQGAPGVTQVFNNGYAAIWKLAEGR